MASETIDVPCSYGGVSTGRQSRRISVRIKRGALKLTQARAVLCRAQLKCILVADPNAAGDGVGQGKLLDDAETLEATFETHGLRVDDDEIEFSVALTIPKDAVEDGELDRFAWSAGRLQAERIGDAEKKQPGRKKREAEGESG